MSGCVSRSETSVQLSVIDWLQAALSRPSRAVALFRAG